jgi:hypothetical protein
MFVDFDSYKRRLHALKQSQEKPPAEPKKLEELAAEIARYEHKVETADTAYNSQNAKAKKDILAARVAHDNLVEMMFITFVTCQVVLIV